mmetsp:Transcript_28429/g.34687  ORF Transcript_28429/g.34687 Transcript_28429/m.34687 type:complete len:97 (+) Transcript_28429:181-471(+)
MRENHRQEGPQRPREKLLFNATSTIPPSVWERDDCKEWERICFITLKARVHIEMSVAIFAMYLFLFRVWVITKQICVSTSRNFALEVVVQHLLKLA